MYLISSFNFTVELSVRQFQHLKRSEMQNPSPCDVPPVSPLRTLKVQQTSLSTHAILRLISSGCRRHHSRSVDMAAALSAAASQTRPAWAERRQLPWVWKPGSYQPLDHIRTSIMMNSTPGKAAVKKQIELPGEPFKISCITVGTVTLGVVLERIKQIL